MTDNLKTSAQREMVEQQKVMREIGPYMSMGIQLALTILAFFGLGYWLDHQYSSGSLWRAVCTGFGAFASLVYFVVTVMRLSKREEKDAARKKETKAP